MHDPLLGQLVDGYVIQELLGRGGMARVYRATDQTLHRDVALKILHAGSTQGAGGAERFAREARTLANLQHPAIVQIYNVGEFQGLSYLIQEFLPGPTLDAELRQLHAQGQAMAPSEVQRIITRLASALDYAHQRGIIHRDLKPANVMRSQHGEVMLLDFGIAKASGEHQKLTQTGLVLGTPAYLAPEQCTGDPDLTHAVDIYALGIILYELLAGRVPFDDPSALAVAMAHVSTPPPPIRTVRPDVPVAVEAVVLRALEKNPADRYPSASALAAELERAWTTPAQPAPVAASLHDTRTAVNPALPARTHTPSPQDAPTRVNPALSGPATPAARRIPRSSGGSSRWISVGVVLLALLGGWLVLGRDGDGAAMTGGQAAHPPGESALAAPGDAAFAPAGTGQDTNVAPSTWAPIAIPSTPDAILSSMHDVLDAAVGSDLADAETAAVLHAHIAEVEQALSAEASTGKGKGQGKGNGNGKDKGNGRDKGDDKGNGRDKGDDKDNGKDKGNQQDTSADAATARATLERAIASAHAEGRIDGQVASQLSALLSALPF